MQWKILSMCKLVNTEREQWNGGKPQVLVTRFIKLF